jgi:hypothetical protein
MQQVFISKQQDVKNHFISCFSVPSPDVEVAKSTGLNLKD